MTTVIASTPIVIPEGSECLPSCLSVYPRLAQHNVMSMVGQAFVYLYNFALIIEIH